MIDDIAGISWVSHVIGSLNCYTDSIRLNLH